MFGIKYNGEEMQIDKIPEGQLCQVFDPIMIDPEKVINILEDPMQTNTSCVAPAYVYMEGTRGKRFLCDYHYGLEMGVTCDRTPHLWNDIAYYVVDEREKIKETFDIENRTNVATKLTCWCGSQAFVLIINKKNKVDICYCNFHYRKAYYRYLSNGKRFEDIFFIIDERNKMTISIEEETNNIINIFEL